MRYCITNNRSTIINRPQRNMYSQIRDELAEEMLSLQVDDAAEMLRLLCGAHDWDSPVFTLTAAHVINWNRQEFSGAIHGFQ